MSDRKLNLNFQDLLDGLPKEVCDTKAVQCLRRRTKEGDCRCQDGDCSVKKFLTIFRQLILTQKIKNKGE